MLFRSLARQKGWDVKIPQLDDGTYNCDVFGGDEVCFNFKFVISGILYLKDNATLQDNISAHEGIILGNYAYTLNLFSNNGDIILGNYADTCNISGRNIICGDNFEARYCNISTTIGFVILGKESVIHNPDEGDSGYNGYVSATEDIIFDDEIPS